ncbi:MAG: hypothetical protein KDJ29_18955 [Hyphomicrobiales bacterium]|nr:hypothetical protein [Hyphomicrobiales bacterium]
MSFSSNVISNPPPPATPMVRILSGALWVLPVLISVGCLAASPSKAGKALAALLKAKQQPIVLATAIVAPETALEPESFSRIASARRFGSAMDIRLRNDARFPMRLAYSSQIKPGPVETQIMARANVASKSTMKVQPAARMAAASPVSGVSQETVSSITSNLRNIATATLVETRIFEDARVASANMLSADGLTIILAGINAPKSGSKCRRLDGAMLDCAERAEARLAVLLIDRRVKCRISAPIQEGVVVGQCHAGKIDIASDLLRNGLANRTTAGKRATVL